MSRARKERRIKQEEKQPVESSESLPHLIYPVQPSPPPPPLHQLHTTGDTARDTDTRKQLMRQKCRKPNSTCEKKEEDLNKKESSQWNLPHLLSISSVLFNFPPLDHSTSHTLPETQSGTRISETVHEIEVRKPDQICKQFMRTGEQPPSPSQFLAVQSPSSPCPPAYSLPDCMVRRRDRPATS